MCSKGKEMMASVTISLIDGYPLNIELDSKDTYLLYRDLPTVEDEHLLSLENLKVRNRERERERRKRQINS